MFGAIPPTLVAFRSTASIAMSPSASKLPFVGCVEGQARANCGPDALCINQDDNEEKNKQVPEMARIYTQASRVLVWLGEASANVRTAVSCVERHRRARPFLHQLKLRFLCPLSATARVKYRQEVKRAALGSLEIFNHPY